MDILALNVPGAGPEGSTQIARMGIYDGGYTNGWIRVAASPSTTPWWQGQVSGRRYNATLWFRRGTDGQYTLARGDGRHHPDIDGWMAERPIMNRPFWEPALACIEAAVRAWDAAGQPRVPAPHGAVEAMCAQGGLRVRPAEGAPTVHWDA